MAVQTSFDFAASPAGAGRRAPGPIGDPEHETGRSRSVLERRLGELMARPISLTLTDNERTMISARRRGDVEHVRLHHMFVEADEPVVRALAAFLKDGDRLASQHLEHYVGQRRDRIRTRPRRKAALSGNGSHHDLAKVFDYLNARYFDDGVDAEIGWGRHGRAPGKRRRRRSIKLGSYRQSDATIRVHPVLDAAWVPEFFVEYVVYHEMLHHVIGIPVEDGKRRMHTAEFRRRERGYARYQEATSWERDNLERLLSS